MATRKWVPVTALGATFVASVAAWYLVSGSDWVRVTTVETLADNVVVPEPDLNVFIVDTNAGPLALSAKVPHERTDYVRFCPSSGLFEAAFLGAKFDRLGIYYGGPGERSLDRLKSKVEDGVVYVNPNDITRGPARGDRDPIEPKGPFCDP